MHYVSQYDRIVMALCEIIATNYINRAERALVVSLSVGKPASNNLSVSSSCYFCENP
jgi:hypothetical protein